MNIGSVLSCSPHIIENIFQHLSSKDLSNCGSVCKLWAIVSQEEIQRRKGIVSFFQGIKCGKHRKIHRTFENCSMRQASKFEKELKAQFENVSIKPAFCIAFATTGFLEHFAQLFPSHFGVRHPRKRIKRCYMDYFETAIKIALQENLPSSCCVSLYIEDDIIYYSKDLHCSSLGTNAPAICGYLFSKFPDEELNLYKRKEQTGKILKHIIMNGPNMKTSLNLVDYQFLPYFQIALNELKHRHNAFESGIIMPVRRASNYIPVFEGPNVQVFRFAIGHYIFTLEESRMDVIMNQWRHAIKEKKGLNDKTIAFMFSRDYCNCLMVCEAFKMVFPEVPLVGLFKYSPPDLNITIRGDYCNSLIDRSVRESGLKYSCVFIIVSFIA